MHGDRSIIYMNGDADERQAAGVCLHMVMFFSVEEVGIFFG